MGAHRSRNSFKEKPYGRQWVKSSESSWISSIDRRQRQTLGKCRGTVRDGPPATGIHWYDLEMNQQVSGMIRNRAGRPGMNFGTLPN